MKDSRRYYRNVKKLFPIYGKREKDFLNNFHEQIDEFEADKPFCTYEQLEERFGAPLDILKSYYDSIDSAYIINRLNIKKAITITCVMICAIVLSLGMWKSYLIYKDYVESSSQRVTRVEITAPEVIE